MAAVSEVVETFDTGQAIQNEEIERVTYMQMELAARVDEIQSLVERAPARPRTIVQEKAAFTEEQKRAALAAIMGGGDDEDER